MAPAKGTRNVRLVQSIQSAEQASLNAVRRFLDTIDEAFPHVSDDKPRRKVIDSAFEMTEHLVAAATRFAENILDLTQQAVSESERKPAKRTPAKAAKVARKAPAKKAPAKKAPAKKAAGTKRASATRASSTSA
jgi:hypothetical protein